MHHIGYGDVACNTSIGRLTTVIYAIIGIPIMLITLRDLGNFLYKVMINVVRLVHFKSRFGRIFGHTINKTFKQSISHDLMQLECGIAIGADNSDIEHDSENNGSRPAELKFDLADEFNEGQFSLTIVFHASLQIFDWTKEDDARMMVVNDMISNKSERPSRIPVLLAIGITFSWIFLCAGLFKIWERDWTYAESCYFMFIRQIHLRSLSTIGLGDLSVRRRDLMTMCFVFVIFGLAMVSMCINVIQTALEDFYTKVFLKLFLEYQSKLNQGNDAVGASVSLMQMWGNNKKAKYLMSFLSKNRRASVLAKVQKDAKAHGIEIPPIFSDIDDESGIPKLFTQEMNEETLADTVEKAIQQHSEIGQFNVSVQTSTELSLPTTVFDDKGEQTSMAVLLDTAIITDSLINETVEKNVQCINPELVHSTIQTEIVELRDDECATIIPEHTVCDVQTDELRLIGQEIQTDLYDVLEAITQTEADELIQQPFVEMVESEVQTEPNERLLRKTNRRPSAVQSLSGGSEDEEMTDEDEESDNLDWNPIDGMHAEKQHRVRDLMHFFETQKKMGPIIRKSQFRISSSSSPSRNFKM
uniref:Ion_trans_2 domain-containing protein n=1 Tax=Elaeophora elaphi TaxID=1147741 RepID=A0A0R3S6H0_9BILA